MENIDYMNHYMDHYMDQRFVYDNLIQIYIELLKNAIIKRKL